MNNISKAKELLKWNSANLVHDADLNKNDLGLFFAENFKVIANGKSYAANYDNYYDFLNNFRADIKSITYDIYEYIDAKHHVSIPLTAHITRTTGNKQDFEAILLLKFDSDGQIILWHEVYLELARKI